MSETREDLFAALNRAEHARKFADQRLRNISQEEVEAAEDPIAFQDLERDLEAVRHEINALDVEIATLEQKIADLGGREA